MTHRRVFWAPSLSDALAELLTPFNDMVLDPRRRLMILCKRPCLVAARVSGGPWTSNKLWSPEAVVPVNFQHGKAW
jgi:hypothetical protein